jgi:hypothetical protein
MEVLQYWAETHKEEQVWAEEQTKDLQWFKDMLVGIKRWVINSHDEVSTHRHL